MLGINMEGPYRLTEDNVRIHVAENRKGNFVLGEINNKGIFNVSYVGMSDSNLQEQLLYWADNSIRTYFKFAYVDTVKDAYKMECNIFHSIHPKDNDFHPDKPKNSNFKCPYCNEKKGA